MVPDTLFRRLRHLLAVRSRPDDGRFDLRHLVSRPRAVNEARIRALCRTAPLGEGDALARVLGRYKMVVDTRDFGLSAHLLLDGYWEMWVTQAMARLVRPGMTVADIGANLGYYTLLLGDLVGAAGRVHAFEPNPALAARLRRSLRLSGSGARTTLHEIALGDADAPARLRVPADDPKNATLVEGVGDGDALPVAVRRLDGIADLADVDLVKIDVEGHEEAVWRGMAGVLARRRPMIVLLEWCAGRYADPAAFLDAILGEGFALAVVEPSARIVPLARAALLARPADEDQMLLLRRGAGR